MLNNTTFRWVLLCGVFLVILITPFLFFGTHVEDWTNALTRSSDATRASVALSCVLFLSVDIVLPVPSSAISVGAGLLLGIVGGTVASWIGMTAACMIGFWLGRSAGRKATDRLVGEEELRRLELLSQRWGDWAIIMCRPIPVLAEASVLFAGIGRMRMWRFALLVALSNLGVSLVYATVGALSAATNSLLLALLGSVVFPVVGMLVVKRWKGNIRIT